MNPIVSRRGRSIQPSATLELSARSKALQAEGKPILNLTAGEPDGPPPPGILAAAAAALDERHSKYTPTPGWPALREGVAQLYGGRLGQEFRAENVVVSNGAKHSLYNALASATDAGDRIGMLCPYWVTYAEQARALGCEPVAIECPKDTGFRPDLEALDAALSRGLRVLVVNSPCNPTGAAYSRADWEPLLERLAATDTLLISDEIYADIVYGSQGHVSPLHVRPDLTPRTCVVTGLSKSYAMTGWRVGFSLAPVEWTRAMSALQSHTTSNINAVAQEAAIAAIEHPEVVAPLQQRFAKRRSLVMEAVSHLPGVSARDPEGTFYLFLDVSAILGMSPQTESVDALAAWLLDDVLVSVIPGSAFGDQEHLRLSFAVSDATLTEAFARMSDAFSQLHS